VDAPLAIPPRQPLRLHPARYGVGFGGGRGGNQQSTSLASPCHPRWAWPEACWQQRRPDSTCSCSKRGPLPARGLTEVCSRLPVAHAKKTSSPPQTNTSES
jgi:hypothetical protein